MQRNKLRTSWPHLVAETWLTCMQQQRQPAACSCLTRWLLHSIPLELNPTFGPAVVEVES